jgi:rare lipoprotein A (peptidoglycan hydrolase)
MVAAAGSELRRPGWRGSWVRVHANGRHVDVQLVDWCLCRGSRIVDLYAAAFSRLAPTSRGEIFVTVEWLGPRLPPTDMKEGAPE